MTRPSWTRLAEGLREAAPLVVLLATGLVLRVALSLSLAPAALNQFDANAYVLNADGDLFGRIGQAPGYSIFLRSVHLLSDQVAVTISVQHLIALLTATIVWLTVRRLTGSRWLALVPAAVLVLNADSLLIEHALMTETLFTGVVVSAISAALVAPQARRPELWLLACSLLLGAAVWIRYAALVLVPIVAIWAAVCLPRPRLRAILTSASTAVAPAFVVVVGLVVAQGQATGIYGLGAAGGWGLYSRVASFADCTRFAPPPGTESLCETTPPELRRNPDWYGYNKRSPAVRLFGGPPTGDGELRTWARRALLAQPLDYVATVIDDLSLYVDEQPWTNRDRSLIGPKAISFTLRTPDSECPPQTCRAPPLGLESVSLAIWTDPMYGAYYADFEPRAREGIAFFEAYQRILRFHGPLVGLVLVLAVVGLLAVRGPLARAQWLLSLSGLALLVFPTAVATYNARYALPALPLLTMAAVLAPLSLREGAGWIGSAFARLRGTVR